MSLDPRIFGTSDGERAAEAIAALDRAARSPAASVAEFAEALATVATTSASYVDLGGPSIDLQVPEGGAFVQLYAEVEMRIASGTQAPRATIVEPTDFPSGNPNYLRSVNGAFEKVRQTTGINGTTGLGTLVQYWATAGTRTFSIRYTHDGGASPDVQFRNRRLWARVTR